MVLFFDSQCSLDQITWFDAFPVIGARWLLAMTSRRGSARQVAALTTRAERDDWTTGSLPVDGRTAHA